jgi:uncharacterized protein YciI
MHFILFYEVEDDYLARRGVYRTEHLGLARAAVERGEMVMAGAFDEPADGAALIFRGDSPRAAEAFAQNDPYVKNGLVKRWRVRKWNVVVGEGATPP